MLTRLIVGVPLLAVAMTANPRAVTPDATRLHASLVTFQETTRVCDHLLQGQYVVVHDDDKMARGEPCTTFYRMKKGEAEAVASFHCIPRQNGRVEQTTVTVVRRGPTTTTYVPELIEYQIAGDTEAHGVPVR